MEKYRSTVVPVLTFLLPLHALIDTKRGAHLMLSLARLDILCKSPLQRIGLSATIEPLDVAARYLALEEVKIAAPVMKKQVRLPLRISMEKYRSTVVPVLTFLLPPAFSSCPKTQKKRKAFCPFL